MPTLLHKCRTKATTAQGDQRSYGPSWVAARRGSLKVFDDHLECGDWRIAYADIRSGVLYSFRTTFLRIPCYILTIATDQVTYHFGLQGGGTFWEGELPFGVERESGRLRMSWFSIIVRVIAVAYIVYGLWRWIGR